MANPQMVAPGPGMAGQAMVPGSSGQMHPRVPRPASQSGLVLSFSLHETIHVAVLIMLWYGPYSNGKWRLPRSQM